MRDLIAANVVAAITGGGARVSGRAALFGHRGHAGAVTIVRDARGVRGHRQRRFVSRFGGPLVAIVAAIGFEAVASSAVHAVRLHVGRIAADLDHQRSCRAVLCPFATFRNMRHVGNHCVAIVDIQRRWHGKIGRFRLVFVLVVPLELCDRGGFLWFGDGETLRGGEGDLPVATFFCLALAKFVFFVLVQRSGDRDGRRSGETRATGVNRLLAVVLLALGEVFFLHRRNFVRHRRAARELPGGDNDQSHR